MHYRPLGTTGIQVSEIGMGCNRLSEDHQPQNFWVDLVKEAADLGVSLFDTAEAYGWGASEEVLGLALGNRDDVYIASKMCRVRHTNEREYSAARMQKTAEESLKRLQRDCIDIYQLHSPNREDMQRFDWPAGMDRLKKQGKIRCAAVAVNSAADALWLIQQGSVDALQITYNIFSTEAEAELFDRAREKGVGLLCRLPLAQGILTGKFNPETEVPDGHRARLAGENMAVRIARAEDLRPLGETYAGGMTRMAHHFSLTPRAVSAIIPGARTSAQLRANVAASNNTGLDENTRAQIRTIQSQWTS